MEKVKKKTLKVRIKYGFNGLVAAVYSIDSSRKLSEVTISTDSNKIFKFLGYDYEEYSKGFDTLDEIFNWTVQSKYFTIDSFLMDNLNAVDRKRNKKRKTYQEFLTWANENSISSNYTFNKDKDSYIDMIDEFFPEANFKEQLEILRKRDAENKLISEKLNGRMIMEWTGITGKELGNLIGKFDEFLGDKRRDWILSNSSEDIEKLFKDWYAGQ